MAIDLAYECDYYRKELMRSAQVNAALQRQDVQQALERCPDADCLSAGATTRGVVISVFAGLDADPAIAEVADGCDGNAYLLNARQCLLEVPDVVTVEVRVTGRWPLGEDDRELLRRIGKLQTEACTREYLVCAA
jgi:hypothetical protein